MGFRTIVVAPKRQFHGSRKLHDVRHGLQTSSTVNRFSLLHVFLNAAEAK
jgi:hypothetical protein